MLFNQALGSCSTSASSGPVEVTKEREIIWPRLLLNVDISRTVGSATWPTTAGISERGIVESARSAAQSVTGCNGPSKCAEGQVLPPSPVRAALRGFCPLAKDVAKRNWSLIPRSDR